MKIKEIIEKSWQAPWKSLSLLTVRKQTLQHPWQTFFDLFFKISHGPQAD